MGNYVFGASVSGKPHLVKRSAWPTIHNRLVLARCGRPTIREVPEPTADELCGNCRLLHEADQRRAQPDPETHALETVRQQIADEITHRRHRLASPTAASSAVITERAAIITGLLIALSIALGAPGDQHATDLYIQQRLST
ncbi:hypothetical protein AB5J72_06415 [Streptomyces sp. CG1]|uniref:hypothetical protein n=1 Tax=Streptomyces sp. CG1 TaxID=1287523 RepID=UPI0034E2A8CD